MFFLVLLGLFGNFFASDAKNIAEVVKIIDGDTVEAYMCSKIKRDPGNPKGLKCEHGDNSRVRIRLLGIDCPEKQQFPWGMESKRFLADIVSPIKPFVVVETDIDPEDRYGRKLAYLYSYNPSGQIMRKSINQIMLEEGYAELLIFKPNAKYMTEFKIAQAEARMVGKNIWNSANGLKESPSIFRKKWYSELHNESLYDNEGQEEFDYEYHGE